MIGASYPNAIGSSYPAKRHHIRVNRKPRTVWERVKEVLEERELPATQKYFAERILHIKQPSIAEWNRPGVYPRMENAIAAAIALGVAVEWLLTERGPKYVLPKNEADSEAMFRIWHEMDGIARSRLLAHAQILGAAVPEYTALPKQELIPARRPR